MPIFKSKYGGKAKDEDGNVKEIIPAFALAHLGPRMEVSVGITPFLIELLKNEKRSVPKTIDGTALIDTGATITSIDEELAQVLKLPVIGKQHISTPSHERYEVKVYSHGLITLKDSPVNFEGKHLLGVPLRNQGIQILFGRDFLAAGILIYDGPDGSISFSM